MVASEQFRFTTPCLIKGGGKMKLRCFVFLVLFMSCWFRISHAVTMGVSGGSGEINTLSSVGTATSIVSGKVAADLQTKSLAGTGGTTITNRGNYLEINSTSVPTFATQADVEGGTESTKAVNSLRAYQAITYHSFLKSNIDISPADGYPDKANGWLGTTLAPSDTLTWVMPSDTDYRVQLSGDGSSTVSRSGVIIDLMKGTQYIDLTPNGAGTATASGGLQKLAEGTITAGHMGTRGVCKIYSLWGWPNDTASKNPQIMFGDFLVYNGTSTSGTTMFNDCRIIRNINSASIQRSSFGLTSANSFTTSSATAPQGTFNTGNDTPIIISCNPGTNTVSLIHAFAEVTYIP